MEHYAFSFFLGKLLGVYLIVIAVAMLLNRSYYVGVAKKIVEQPVMLFFAGLLDLIFGLAIVLVHNHWRFDWTVLVTIMGWIALIKGVVRLVFPTIPVSVAQKLQANVPQILFGSAIFFLVYGIVLSYFSFFIR